MPNIALDLTKRHFVFTKGPVTMIGTWVRNDGKWEPCIALVRSGEEMAAATVPCVVTLGKAWIWSEDMGDPRKAARIALGFMQALRLDSSDPLEVLRLAGFINDHLGDLLTIPILPPGERPQGAIIGDITVTNRSTGKVTREDVLRDV